MRGDGRILAHMVGQAVTGVMGAISALATLLFAGGAIMGFASLRNGAGSIGVLNLVLAYLMVMALACGFAALAVFALNTIVQPTTRSIAKLTGGGIALLATYLLLFAALGTSY